MEEQIQNYLNKIIIFLLALETNPHQALRDSYEELDDDAKYQVAQFASFFRIAGKAGMSLARICATFHDSDSFANQRKLIHQKLGKPSPPEGWCKPE